MEKNDKITVYSPTSALKEPFTLFAEMVRDLINARELAWQLAVRDIRSQYRQAALGLLWAFILPLAHCITWIFLRASGVVSLNETALPYPIYVFTGTMIWAIFMEAVRAPLEKTTTAKPMLAKINFPREAIIISGIYQTGFNAIIKISLVIVALAIFGIQPGLPILLIPVGILSLILTGTMLGILLTPIGILYTDIGKSLPLLLQFLMYVTPVVFTIPETKWPSTIFKLNPLTPLIVTVRDWLTGFTPESYTYFIIVNMAVFFLLLMVWVIYRVAMPIVIERMSA